MRNENAQGPLAGPFLFRNPGSVNVIFFTIALTWEGLRPAKDDKDSGGMACQAA
jgi:hypothetical protein